MLFKMRNNSFIFGVLLVLSFSLLSCVHKSGHRKRYEERTDLIDKKRHVLSPERHVTKHAKIRMVKENGVYYVPIEVNGLNLRFIFDTGASSISISSAEAAVMYRQGLITEDDILGASQMQDATGGISTGVVVNLRSVKIGDIILNNIQATVVDNIQAPLLLGQTALSKFGKVSLDYEHGYIEFN